MKTQGALLKMDVEKVHEAAESLMDATSELATARGMLQAPGMQLRGAEKIANGAITRYREARDAFERVTLRD